MRISTLGGSLLFLLLAACGGDSNGPSGGTLTNGSFSAKVDGSSYAAVSATVVISGQITSIGAATSSGKSIAFAWQDTGVGTVTFSPTGIGNALYTEAGAGWVAGAAGGSGTITITTRTANRVAGTFSFTLIPSSGGASGNKTITNGSFDLTY